MLTTTPLFQLTNTASYVSEAYKAKLIFSPQCAVVCSRMTIRGHFIITLNKCIMFIIFVICRVYTSVSFLYYTVVLYSLYSIDYAASAFFSCTVL